MIARRIVKRLTGSLLVVLLATGQSAVAGPYEQGEDGSGMAPALASPRVKVRFRLLLPLRHEDDLDRLLLQQADANSVEYHKWLSSKAFADRFLPTPQQLAKLARVAQTMGLTTVGTDAHSVTVEATAAQLETVFSTQLRYAKRASGLARLIAPGPLASPAMLAETGALTPAFANVALPQPAAWRAAATSGSLNRVGRNGPYWFTDLKQAYDYPAYNSMRRGKRVDGTGASVAVLMAGDVLDSDIEAMFRHERWSKFTSIPVPAIGRLLVNGGPVANVGDTGFIEASLDIQMVLGGAPGASTTLIEIPDLSDSNIIDGLIAIVDSNAYDIVSMSIGSPQNFYLPGYNGGVDYRPILRLYDALFKQGCAQGITFIAGSGDQGGLASPSANYFNNDPRDRPVFVRGVNFLSDSPHVTSVGGGNLITTASVSADSSGSAYLEENGTADRMLAIDMFKLGKAVQGGFWGAGGGVSFLFARPSWQASTQTGTATARTEPDVGMQVGGCPGDIVADPACASSKQRSAVYVYLAGKPYPLIGTSVAAPEFASAVALFVGQNGRQGNLNPYLYQMAREQARGGAKAFHQSQQASDGYWSSADQGPSYNYIFGNGSPDVRVLFGFTDLPAADAPGTAQNP